MKQKAEFIEWEDIRSECKYPQDNNNDDFYYFTEITPP